MDRLRYHWVLICLGLSLGLNIAAIAKPCSKKQLQLLTSHATASKKAFSINCQMNIPKNVKRISKQIIFYGSNANHASLNCQGAVLEPSFKGFAIAIRSKQLSQDKWQPPHHIIIKNCVVKGAIRIWGMARNGEGKYLRISSRKLGHTERAQHAAPSYITFNNMTIIAHGTIPFYMSPGVTHVQLLNSTIKGFGTSTAIYLDAESGYNTIKNNKIAMKSRRREQLAIDGSAHNQIIDNQFSGLSTGGIYVYRNCGEGGTIRHQTPSYNRIVNNTFYYRHYKGNNPAIWVGSRNGNRRYCNRDSGYPFGSSADNRDNARYNVIERNRIIGRSVYQMIRVSNSPNTIAGNQTLR